MDLDFKKLADMLVDRDKDGNFKQLKQGTKDGIGKLASFLGGKFEKNRAKEELEAGIEDKKKFYEDLKDTATKAYEKQQETLMNTVDATQASEDLMQAQKNTAEEILRAQDFAQQQNQQDIVDLLQSGDPRGPAALESILQRQDSVNRDARMQALKTKTDADKLAADLAEQNKAMKLGLRKGFMERAGMGADDANMALLDLATAEQSADAKAKASGAQTALALDAMLKSFDPGNPGKAKHGTKIKYEDGGYMGEEGFKTEGEFDHDTNKKAVIDEENGKKEAELTGGEIVFNPKQTKDMEKLIEQGDAKALMEFMKDLLSKPQFQD